MQEEQSTKLQVAGAESERSRRSAAGVQELQWRTRCWQASEERVRLELDRLNNDDALPQQGPV